MGRVFEGDPKERTGGAVSRTGRTAFGAAWVDVAIIGVEVAAGLDVI